MKHILIIAVIFCATSISVAAQTDSSISTTNDGSLWLGVGSKDGSFILSLAARHTFYGGDISIKFDGEQIPVHHDFRIPHNDYTVREYKESSMAVNGILGWPLGEIAFPYVLIGGYVESTTRLARSNVTYEYYTTLGDGSSDTYFNYGAGLQVNLLRHLAIGVQWSVFAGTQGQLAVVW